MYTRNTKNFDHANFVLDYLNINWTEILEIEKNDVNHSLSNFMNKTNELVDKYMPMVKISQKEFKRKYKPWITNEILNKISDKNKKFKKYIRCKDENLKTKNYDEYKTIKNDITFLTRQSERKYY